MYVLEPVLYSGKVIVDAVGVGGVEAVIDGDEPNAVLRKGEVGIKPGQRRVTAQTGEVFRNGDSHSPGLNLGQHRLEAGAVIGHATHPIVHKENRIREMMFFSVAEQDGFLVLYGQGLPGSFVLLT